MSPVTDQLCGEWTLQVLLKHARNAVVIKKMAIFQIPSPPPHCLVITAHCFTCANMVKVNCVHVEVGDSQIDLVPRSQGTEPGMN